MPSLEDARKNRDRHHKHPNGGLTPSPHHSAGSPHAAPVHSSTPKNTQKPPTVAQIKRTDSKTDKPAVAPFPLILVEPFPVQRGANISNVAYRPSPRKPGSSSKPTSGHPFKAASVHRGDSLWRIAKRELGSGHRWREIRTAHGGHLTERGAKRLQIGTPIYLPSSSTSSSQNNLSTPTSATSSVSGYSKKSSNNLTTKPVPFTPASDGNLKTKPTSSTALAPTSQRKPGVKPAPLISTASKNSGTRRESGIQRYTPTVKKNLDSRSTTLSSTARRNPGGQPIPFTLTNSGGSRAKRESSQMSSQPPASWAGFPVLTAQVTQSRVAQAHHVATRVGSPISKVQSSAALAGGVRGAVLLKPPSTINPVVEAFGNTQVRGAAKGAFKVLAPIGLAVDAVQLRSAWKKDHGFGPNVRKVAGSATGGWVGAAGGVELGAAIGSLVPGVGTVIGALVGGMAGAVTGSRFGEKVAERGEQSFQGERTQQTNNFSRANQYPHW
jgi:hypothetical protein